MNKPIFLLIAVLISCTHCFADTNWIGSNGSWTNSSNWNLGVPDSSDVVGITLASPLSITNVSGTISDLIVSGGNASLTLSGNATGLTLNDVELLAGAFTANLPFTFNAGSTITHQATQNATFTQLVTIADGDALTTSTTVPDSTARIFFNGGLAGEGALQVFNAWVVLSTASTYTAGTQVLDFGVLTVTNATGSATGTGEVIIGESSQLEGNGTLSGDLTFNTAGIFRANLITPPGSHVPLKVGGTLSLEDTPVNLTFSGGTPSAGTYTLIEAASVTGNATLGMVDPLPVGLFVSTPQVVGNNLVVVFTGGGYSTWSGGASATADANNDGVSNLMAYALGAGNTTASARTLLPTLTGTPGNYSYTVNATQQADLVYEVQLSTSTTLNATVWTNASGTATTGGVVARKSLGGAWTEIMGGEPNGITVNATASGVQIIDTNNTGRRFWRLSVASGNITVTR